MRVKHYQGAVVDVPKAKAAKLVACGSWTYVDTPPEKPAEPVSEAPQGEDTGGTLNELQTPSEPQEEAPVVATIGEMRAWALSQGIEGVKEKGKLSRSAIEAYQEAHKE
jgi:hypothetical protein